MLKSPEGQKCDMKQLCLVPRTLGTQTRSRRHSTHILSGVSGSENEAGETRGTQDGPRLLDDKTSKSSQRTEFPNSANSLVSLLLDGFNEIIQWLKSLESSHEPYTHDSKDKGQPRPVVANLQHACYSRLFVSLKSPKDLPTLT